MVGYPFHRDRAKFYELCNGVDTPLRELTRDCKPLEAYLQWKAMQAAKSPEQQDWQSQLYLALAALLHLLGCVSADSTRPALSDSHPITSSPALGITPPYLQRESSAVPEPV